MEKKINIAELLKDCPKGMELDCTVYNDVTFLRIDEVQNRCYFKAGPADTFWTTCEGRINGSPFGKCVIFPKGKTTWEGFVHHCKFKDGDIVATNEGSWIGIVVGGYENELIPTYCVIKDNAKFEAYFDEKRKLAFDRLATEEEKQKLFEAIKENGYKWNAETKTLEKLIEPKFKVGDRVLYKTYGIYTTIKTMKWNAEKEQFFYRLDSKKLFVATVDELKPCKKETMEERKYSELRMPLDDDDKLATEATIDGDKITPPENYLIGKITKVDNGMLVEFVKKQPKYPKTFVDCCEILYPNENFQTVSQPIKGHNGKKLFVLQKLLICRDAYWKIAGEQMGLGKPWKQDYDDRCFIIANNEGNIHTYEYHGSNNVILAFPSEEIRDVFYGNFKELIETCKELL